MNTSQRPHPYYIVCPPYVRTSAGIKSMHLLGHHLVEAGQEAYIHAPWINPDLKAPRLTPQIVKRHESEGLTPIVMYSESLWGNPLNAACVIRYVGNFLGLLGGPPEFPPDQLMVWHSKDLAEAHGDTEDPLILSVPTTDTSIFHLPKEEGPRPLTCYYASKFKHWHHANTEDYFQLPEGCIEITRDMPDSQTPQEIAEIFQNSAVFYAFENTSLSLEALLCGCKVQLIPNLHFSKPLHVEPFGMDGMAWGLSQKENQRASETACQIPKKFGAWKEHFRSALERFIKVSQSRVHRLREAPSPHFIEIYGYMRNDSSKSRRLITMLLKRVRLYGFTELCKLSTASFKMSSYRQLMQFLRLLETQPGLRAAMAYEVFIGLTNSTPNERP